MASGVSKKLYHAYAKKQDEVNNDLAQLYKEKEEVMAPFDKKIKDLKKNGGERTASVNAEIKELDAKKAEIAGEYDKKMGKLWDEFYNDPMFVGKKEKLLVKDKKRSKTKTNIKKAVAVIGGYIASGAVGKLLHKKTVAERTTEQYYLEHSNYAQRFTDSVIQEIEEGRTSSEAEQRIAAECYNTDGLTPSNLVERIREGADAYTDGLLNDPERMNVLVQEVQDITGQEVSREFVENTINANKEASIQFIHDQLLVEYNPTEMAAAVPDYTLAFASIGGLLSFTLLFGPYLYNRAKLKSFCKKFEKKKKETQVKIEALTAERDGELETLDKQIQEKEPIREAAYRKDVAAGTAELIKQKNEACILIDLQIEQAQTLGELYYYEFLLGMANDGETLAPSKDDASKVVKVGKPQSYARTIEVINAKLDKLYKKIEKMEGKPSAMV